MCFPVYDFKLFPEANPWFQFSRFSEDWKHLFTTLTPRSSLTWNEDTYQIPSYELIRIPGLHYVGKGKLDPLADWGYNFHGCTENRMAAVTQGVVRRAR